MSNTDVYAVIMAGGCGERFWPMGREKRPKQLLKFFSETTLLETTVQRLFPYLLPENILVLTQQTYVEQIQSLLPIPPHNIIGEPSRRDTAACIALATALIKRRSKGETATIIFLPSDHLISPVLAFQTSLKQAVQEATFPHIVTLGISPIFPATTYGYIHTTNQLSEHVFEVDSFCEKPDIEHATQMVESKQYYWNSGIFVWNTQTICEAFKQHVPALYDFIQEVQNESDPTAFINRVFPSLPKISIDYAVMEKSTHIKLIPSTFHWNDIGSWDALESIFPTDANGSVTKGRQLNLDCKACIIINDSEEEFIGVIGLEKICIVHADHATLVCPISQLQKIKQMLQKVRENKDYVNLL